MTRRKFIIVIALVSAAIVWSCNRDKRAELLEINPSSMPHEGNIHQKTWLAFNADITMKNASKIDEIKQNIILIASTIAQYEPVSISVEKADTQELIRLLGNLDTHHYPIEILELDINDPWIRDTGPTFVFNQEGHKAGINFNFKNEDKTYVFNSKVSDFISRKADAKIIHSNLLLEGGCFDVDGSGTAIMTESCIVNDDRNPYWNRLQVETELKQLLGLQKIIWLKGIEESEISNIHTNSYARFVKAGVVLVHRNNDKESDEYELTRENINIVQEATDATGNALKIIILDTPNSFNANYLGYYLCNRAVIMQAFGDEEADYRARKTLQLAFPDRTIEQIQIDAISSHGGTIHRVTQQEPTN